MQETLVKETVTKEQAGFGELGLDPKILSILAKMQFTTPTPIQKNAIPVALTGKDIIGIAQTGTGKTLAFGLPMLQKILNDYSNGLVILPTRELAIQVEETLQKVGRSLGLRTAVLVGGASFVRQISQLRNNPHVVIATPGRLNDHLEQRTISLQDVGVLVLDEADRMLDMGFAIQIKNVLKHVPAERQTMLFSATMPESIRRLTSEYMREPKMIEVAKQGTSAHQIDQEVFYVRKEFKQKLLSQVLAQYTGTVLVFTRTKHGAEKLADSIHNMGHAVAEIHSNLSLSQRQRALAGFKTGHYRVLVATDIVARGIDVSGIQLVVNYDLPDAPEDYVHRIGRTGRAGLKGKAIAFAGTDQRGMMFRIERLIGKKIPVVSAAN
jgi:ATP-dependent RNA helicase RhlE